MKKIILSIILILLCCNLSAQTSHSKSAYEIQESGCAVMYNGLLWSSRNGLADPSDRDRYYMAHVSDFVRAGGVTESFCRSKKNTLNPMTHHQFFRSNIPAGWRLPTKDELLQLLKSAQSIQTCVDRDPNEGDAYFLICSVPLKRGEEVVINHFTIPMKRTWGSMGPWSTIGIKGSYLVQEGVISFEHSRAIEDGVSGWGTFLEGDLISYGISEYAEFEATYDKPGYVRLVRDL